jgi:multiple sugar transport system permease protein
VKAKNRNERIVLFVILMIVSLFMIYPMIWMLFNSIKPTNEVLSGSMNLLTANPQWENYSNALKLAPFFKYLWNSLFTSVLIVLFQIFLSSLLAYAITQLEFKGRQTIFVIILGTYMLPSAATYVPSYVLLSKMGLMNSLSGLIVSNLANAFMVFLLRQSFLKVPHEIIEASRADGASEWRILWQIVVPMARNSLLNAAIISFISNFNSYLWPSLIINDKSKYLISVGLNKFSSSQGAFGETFPLIMAATVISVFPLIIVYFILQKYFIGAVQSSSVKG